MVKTQILFDLRRLGNPPYLAAMVIPKHPNKTGVPFGTPCLMQKSNWEYKGSADVRLLFPFPRNKGYAANESYKLKKQSVIITGDDPFINYHKVKMISTFDWSKVEAIQKYVEANGSLTIHMSNYSPDCGGELVGIAMAKFFNGISENLFSKYKYNSVEYLGCDDSYRSETSVDLNHFITFLSLPNCIPIFNRKRVHGMGMIYRAVRYKSSTVSGLANNAAQLSVILTNYLDNKYVVDGIAIDRVDPTHKDTLKRMKELALVNAKIKTKKAKQMSKKELSAWGDIRTFRYEPVTTTVYFDTSNSTVYNTTNTS